MSLAAAFLGGAQGRLLPASIPFRFFIAGIVFHIAMWGTLFLAADEVPDFAGGPGLPLAALHLLTLGVFAMVAMGAALQMLPVATRRAVPSDWPVRLAFWLMLPGIALMAYGMAGYVALSLGLGVALAGLGLLMLASLLGQNLARARDLPLVAAYGWGAVASLAALVGLGLALAADYDLGFLPYHGRAALAHLVLAVFGFMGLLVIGFSHILVPMFALSPAPPATPGRLGLACWLAAIVLAAAGAFAGSNMLFASGVVLGLAGALLYLGSMAWVWRRRLRKRLGLSFVLVRLAWACLPASLVLALAATFDLAGPRGPQLAAFVALWGWLLTFLTAILQRIMPFLASMHAAKSNGKAPRVSEMTAERPLQLHAACHVAALLLVGAGIAGDMPLAVRAGAAAGLAGSLAFAAFAWPIVRRLFRAPAGRA